MSKIKLLLLTIAFSLLLVGCNDATDDAVPTDEQQQEKAVLFISAAASLTDAMKEVKEVYEQENRVELTFNFAGSGKLAQQIEQGAPVDVFISANQQWMDILEEEDLILPRSRSDITGNKLVLITKKDSNRNVESFEVIDGDELDQIAIGNPESVPAGQYTEEVLRNLETWDELEEKFVLAKDVRQVLTYVETGNTDIGFVYKSDALITDKVEILAEADTSMHKPIIYPGAITADSKVEEEAAAFLEFLETDTGLDILGKYGFNK